MQGSIIHCDSLLENESLQNILLCLLNSKVYGGQVLTITYFPPHPSLFAEFYSSILEGEGGKDKVLCHISLLSQRLGVVESSSFSLNNISSSPDEES